MKSSLSQTNPGGSVEATPVRSTSMLSFFVSANTTAPEQKTPRLLSGRYLHTLWPSSGAAHEDRHDHDNTVTSDDRKYSDDRFAAAETLQTISVTRTQGSDEIPCNISAEKKSDIIIVEAETVFQHLRSRSPVSSVTFGVSAALATIAKHCPPQLGWKTKTKRRCSSLEENNSPRTATKRRQLVGWGRPRQEEVLLSWLTHALVPSDLLPSDVYVAPSDGLVQDEQVAQDPCDSELGNIPQQHVSHVSVKRRKIAHRTSLTCIPEGEERSPCWLTRPVRAPRTFSLSPQRDLQPQTSPLSHGPTPPITVEPSSGAYASCFANAHRQPSIIRWKLP
ncbi:hypothetical protein DFH29DRAFT_1006013 [Suillus ampliporus]|nr:hypothetical protein DFH29DRAFT_1006013 [Suillus ampliporus]